MVKLDDGQISSQLIMWPIFLVTQMLTRSC